MGFSGLKTTRMLARNVTIMGRGVGSAAACLTAKLGLAALAADQTGEAGLLLFAPIAHAEPALVEVGRLGCDRDLRHDVVGLLLAHLAAGVHPGNGLAHLLGGAVGQ